MNFYSPEISFIFKFYVALSALLAVLEIFKRRDRQPSFVLPAIFIFISALLLRIFVYGISENAPQLWIFAYHATFSLLTGPVLLMQLNRMLRPDTERASPIRWHFLPALIACIADTVFLLQGGQSQQSFLDRRFLHPNYTVLKAVVLLLFLHFASYYLALLFRIIQLRRAYQIDSFASLFATLLLPFAGTILAVAGFQANSRHLLVTGGLMLGATLVLIMIFSARNPGFLETMKKSIGRQKYEKTRLGNLDMDTVCARLEELFITEKVFLDENLTLNRLAADLLINRHQLSRILNENFGKSFSDFVNEFRVNEAKKLLAEKPKATIMRIGFDAGFNNKATFNGQFLRQTGMTPIGYRKMLSKS